MATHSQSPTRRTERLEARVTPAEKELFIRAAEMAGQSLTDFMLTNLHRAAREVEHELHVILLSTADSRRFAEAVLAPPEPNDVLLRAARRYREVAGQPASS